MEWTRKKLIKAYIDFYKSKNHKEIANSRLVPEDDPTVLFTTAGMHPLVPFLLGQKHPQGKRLVNVQKCIRTQDIDEVGDSSHLTFFEMLGNWSLGDYFKEGAIEYSYEFLTKVLKIPKEKIAVSCFGGDDRVSQVPKDIESAKIWEKLGIPKGRIGFLKGGVFESKNNWWGPAGLTGPCGPDTEFFYWIGKGKPRGNPETNEKEWLEIGNDVLMQYVKDEQGNYLEARQKNVDFGGGVERTVAVLNGLEDVYLTDSFLLIIRKIEKLSGKKYGKNSGKAKNNSFPDSQSPTKVQSTFQGLRDEGETRAMRIIADHIKASVMILAEGIEPSSKEQGYVLRRLIRRAVRYGRELGIEENFTKKVAESVLEIYDDYDHLEQKREFIFNEIEKEEKRFKELINEGMKIAEKIFINKKPIEKNKFVKLMLADKKEILREVFRSKREGKDYAIKEIGISKKEIDDATINGEEAFLLYQSYGYPIEMITELVREKGLIVDIEAFIEEEKKHQELSRTATEGKFKSGLADHGEETTKLHTATHLLNQALREVLGKKDIYQKGSNITAERLRFDFNFDRKLSDEELKKIEELVNKKIKEGIDVKREEMSVEQAKAKGAQGVFESKYGEKVSVYSIGNFSKEICAGPHVKNTKELGKFKIIKEESVAAGVRRIKAVMGCDILY